MIAFFYTLSQSLKDILMILLPFLIFFCLSSVLTSFKSSAPFWILTIFSMVVLSNGLPVLVAYGFGKSVLSSACTENHFILTNPVDTLSVLWKIPSIPYLENKYGLILGILVGIILPFTPVSFKSRIHPWLENGKRGSISILQKCFIPFLPIYVFGFVLKLIYDCSFKILMGSFSLVFLQGLVLIVGYLFILYLLAAKGSLRDARTYFMNMLPSAITGFSTMSSMAALPLMMEACAKNTKDQEFSEFIVPATTNNHMVADGLIITLTALALLTMTCQPLPDIQTLLIYCLYYCFIKFSSVGVPGGGVLVVLPVLQTYLGLSPELVGLLTTLYILQDSILTASNILGNGAFSILMHRLFRKKT